MIRVQGYCPMGCGRTLHAEESRAENRVICQGADCPEPLAAQRILDDGETEHVVQFTGGGFTILHPVRERLDNKLLTCELHLVCMDFSGPPDGRGGTFRATEKNGAWVLKRTERDPLAGDAGE